MKNSIKPNFLLLLAIMLSIAFSVHAQNQSMLLPIPGDVDPNPTGSRCINFANPANPSISQLPAHSFEIAPNQASDPHAEGDLFIASSLMNEKYLGQHPMYAQQVVHDKDGNLLFFIVDNNIYNSYGECFLKLDPDGYPYTNNWYTHLLDGVIDPLSNIYPSLNDEIFNGTNLNRFAGGLIDPEIIVFPLKNECYKFGIVFSVYMPSKKWNSSEVFYRKLEYIDENNIKLSDPVALSKYTSDETGCRDESSRGLAISEYRQNDDRYLLFMRYFNAFNIIPIDGSGNIDDANIEENQIIGPEEAFIADRNTPQFSTEMEVVKSADGQYYYVAMGTCYGPLNPTNSTAMLNFFKLDPDGARNK